MCRVREVQALQGYRLLVEFHDGLRGEIDLSSRLFGPVFDSLHDEDLFRQVRVDEFGAICWPNGADLAPDALYERIQRQESLHT